MHSGIEREKTTKHLRLFDEGLSCSSPELGPEPPAGRLCGWAFKWSSWRKKDQGGWEGDSEWPQGGGPRLGWISGRHPGPEPLLTGSTSDSAPPVPPPPHQAPWPSGPWHQCEQKATHLSPSAMFLADRWRNWGLPRTAPSLPQGCLAFPFPLRQHEAHWQHLVPAPFHHLALMLTFLAVYCLSFSVTPSVFVFRSDVPH